MATAAALGLVLAPGAVALALLLAHFRRHRHLPRGLSWMALGTMLWILPSLLRGEGATLHPLQLLAMILMVIAVSNLPLEHASSRIALGLLLGLLLLALVSLLQLTGVASALLAPFVGNEAVARLAEASRAALASGRASGWMDHPNLWATRGLIPSMFVLAAPVGPRWRIAVAVPAVLIALAAGSRATLLGLGVGLLLLGLRWVWRESFGVRELLPTGLALATAAALVLLPPWGSRVRALFDLLPGEPISSNETYNLFASSAALDDIDWFERGVTVARRDGEAQPAWTVRKTLPGSAQRLQQRIDLAPGSYTLSGELLPLDGAARSGLLAFWRDGAGVIHALNVHRVGSDWRTNTQGALTLLWFETTPLEDGWLRLDIGFRNDAESAIVFPVGPTPDQRRVVGSELGVRNLQLARGAAPLPYQPTFPPDRRRLQAQSSAQGRSRIFAAAWRGFVERPLLGHGDDAFGGWFRHWSDNADVDIGHAHNLLLQTLFSRGLIGLLGLALLLLGLTVAAGSAPGFLIVLIAVLSANLFDTTFWTAGQSYLLAVTAGWYAGRQPHARTSTGRSSV